ncbi:MAG: type II secretion system protein GspL [Chromatiales bacterium 21-64-14]|nr:MAG: type II secretion system protein GspL [Chromatiales bacterium 21-64-14]HQU14850.1 type II secretion system protein GspL [Gammaproteobacteria bacterium]
MRETIYIRLGEAGAPAAWLLWDTTGHVRTPVRNGTLEEAAGDAAGRFVVVLVPGDQVTLAHAKVPTSQRQRMIRAIPYALEEHLAEDVDRLHFALGGQDPERGVAVAAVSRAAMDGWLEQLTAAGLHADALIPDTLSLPLKPDRWTAFLEPHRCVLRTGEHAGMVIDPDNLAQFLQIASQEGDPPHGVHLYHDPATPVPAGLDEAPLERSTEEHAGSLMDLLATLGPIPEPARRGINLLQGAYSRREQLGRILRPWRATAALLGVWLLLGMGLQIYEYAHLRAQSQTLSKQIVQFYRQTFPTERRVVNARVQMERHLQALQKRRGDAADGFLALLGQTGTALRGTAGIRLEALNYQGGGLDLRLSANDVQGLDQLKQQLMKEGRLSVEIQSASTHDNRVESRVQIRSKGKGS